MKRALLIVIMLMGTEGYAGARVEVVLPPYLDFAVLDVAHGQAETAVEAFAPGDSQPFRGVQLIRRGGAMSTLVLHRPPAGVWTFRTSSPQARVRIFAQQFFPRGVLVAPPAIAPLRQHARVAVAYRVIDDAGQPLAEIPGYPLSLMLELIAPDGARSVSPMVRRPELGAAVFAATAERECAAAGRYWTEVRVTATDARRRGVEIVHDRWSGFVVTEGTGAVRSSPPDPEGILVSIAERIGLPHEFQTTLLVVALLLALAPYFSGLTIGGIQIPRLERRRRRALKVLGPLTLVLMIGAVLPMEALSPPPTRLQIVACDATDDGGIDLALSNSGTAAALLTRIELEVLALRPTTVRPSLPAAASYRIEMKDPRPGSRHAVVVRHVILPKALERIVLVPQTNRAMRVRLRLFAADGAVMTRDVELWAGAQ